MKNSSSNCYFDKCYATLVQTLDINNIDSVSTGPVGTENIKTVSHL